MYILLDSSPSSPPRLLLHLDTLLLAHDSDEVANLVVANRLIARGHVFQPLDELAGELDRNNVLIVMILVAVVLLSPPPPQM